MSDKKYTYPEKFYGVCNEDVVAESYPFDAADEKSIEHAKQQLELFLKDHAKTKGYTQEDLDAEKVKYSLVRCQARPIPQADINKMHQHYGVHKEMLKMDKETLKKFLEFRVGCLKEEQEEIEEGLKNGSAEDIIDGIIDWIVFGLGTLDLYGVDFNEAWRRVHTANMNKEVGIKEGRPNPFGLPDLLKPEGFENPTHEGNHGKIGTALE